MAAGMIRGALPAVALVVMAAGACSSSSAGATCACADPTVRVDLPPDRAVEVVGVQLSGRACPAAVAQCVQPAGAGCAEYEFEASADGACEVDVTFGQGPADFTAQLTFAQVTCCAGYYVQPPTASPVDVPSVDLDAGARG